MSAAACSPRVDPEDAASWFDDVEANGPSGFVGGGPTVVAEKPPPGSDVGTRGPYVRQDLAQPTDVAAVEGMCFGGGTVSIAISISAADSERYELVDIPCDDERHEVAGARTGVTSFAFGGYEDRWGPTCYAVVVDEA